LSIAATHTQARYVLPEKVAGLRAAFPKVNISLHQGSPDQVARMLIDEVAEIGIATESLANYSELVTLPCYEWQHMLVLPTDHPLARKERITLEDIALEPLITYHPSFTGRTKIDQAFSTRKLEPRIALEAIDSDVIKTYVRLGLGVGIAAEMAVRDVVDDGGKGGLVVRPAGNLFGQNVARVAFKRSAYLRNFVYTFAELLSDRLDRKLIARAMDGHIENYDY
jgi:LysR family cys regulon transcriptional activator